MQYTIYNNGSAVGVACIKTEGLFAVISCCCIPENDRPYRLYLNSGSNQIELGVCPPGDQLVRRISAKSVGKGDISFTAREAVDDKQGIAIEEAQPFPYLEKLPQAYLVQVTASLCIEFRGLSED